MGTDRPLYLHLHDVSTKPRKVYPVIGSRFTPGAVHRDPVAGTYSECMPAELGTEAERLQTALIGNTKPRRAEHTNAIARLVNKPVTWFVGLFGIDR